MKQKSSQKSTDNAHHVLPAEKMKRPSTANPRAARQASTRAPKRVYHREMGSR